MIAARAGGGTVDILLDATNPSRCMAHCHSAEHHTALAICRKQLRRPKEIR